MEKKIKIIQRNLRNAQQKETPETNRSPFRSHSAAEPAPSTSPSHTARMNKNNASLSPTRNKNPRLDSCSSRVCLPAIFPTIRAIEKARCRDPNAHAPPAIHLYIRGGPRDLHSRAAIVYKVSCFVSMSDARACSYYWDIGRSEADQIYKILRIS